MSPQQDCQRLLDHLLPLIENLLETHGVFYPIGACIRTDGTLARFAFNDPRDRPPPAEILAALTQSAITLAAQNQIRAVALLYDVKITLPGTSQKTDAIAANLEHIQNYHLTKLLPYSLVPGQKPLLLPPLTTPKPRQIFRQHPPLPDN